MQAAHDCCKNTAQKPNEETGNLCPLCGGEGLLVSKTTVAHLVLPALEKTVQGKRYCICMSESCDAVYYDAATGAVFLKDQVSVPVWFKRGANPKYACYCGKVTEQQVVAAVKTGGAKTLGEAVAATGAMKAPNCRQNNPLGVCCHKRFQQVLEEALEQKGKGNK